MGGVLQILRYGSMLVLIAGALSACENLKQVDNRGYMESKSVQEEITVGESRKSDVRRVLGSPSTVSAYPPETWYYISRQTETVAFLAPELTHQAVAQIEFDDDGYVRRIENIGKDKAQELEYVSRKTPTDGRTLGFFEQLLGNVGRFNTPRDATQARQ